MITALKVRLEPNNKQNTKLFQSAGTARWAYNWTIARQEENYKNGGKFMSNCDLRKELTQLKQTEKLEWLNHYSNNITKQAVKDACNAYGGFFKGLGKKPKYKTRRKTQPGFYQDTGKIKFKKGKVRLEKIGWVKLSEKDRIPEAAEYKNPRVIFDGIHWYLSIGVETAQEPIELTGETIGIDIGVKYLAICSNREMPYENINKTKKMEKINKRLHRLKRKLSNKYEKNKIGNIYIKSSNCIKSEKNIKKLYKHINNIRTDYRHKVTTEIVKTKPSAIVMENLNLIGMMKDKHLYKAIQQQGLYQFKTFMQYKAEMQGIEFIEADQWYPSSKICSACGHIKRKLPLSEREFRCECCNAVMDRDKNASINLSRYKLLQEM